MDKLLNFSVKAWLSKLSVICFSIFTLILVGQKQTSTASNPAQIEMNAELEALLETIKLKPKLPPLKEASLYFPEVSQTRRLVLKLRERKVYLYRGKEIEVSYPVAIGKNSTPTPKGEYKIIQMIIDPAWENPWTGEVFSPGENSPLGLRWIGFWTDGKDYIGFHGTPNRDSIGQAASNGCVRMRNEDVVALFKEVEMGTPVIVEP
ncbi:MAG: L,D-transpeptidase [Spirulinaceae cyanobacterium]